MLVHRARTPARVGAALLRAAESAAREAGRTLLVLDTVTDGDANGSTYASAGSGWVSFRLRALAYRRALRHHLLLQGIGAVMHR